MLLEKTPALLNDLLFRLVAGKKGRERMLHPAVTVLELAAATANAWIVAADFGSGAERCINHSERAPIGPTTSSLHP